jgi:RNA polymerase sigma-70 factor (ECF subfamily)
LEQDYIVDGERNIISELTFNEVITTMKTLPEDLLATISLVTIEGLSYAEVASILEIPIGTVMSRVSRARHILVDKLNP